MVGSFASGSDVARELSSVQVPTSDLPESMQLARKRNHSSHPDVPIQGNVDVFQSSSMLPNDMSPYGKKEDEKQPWTKFIQHRPLIDRIEDDVIHFKDGTTLEDVDVIIFATGYYYYLPFCKSEDAPWNEKRVCDETVRGVDVLDEINGWEKDGIQGLAMKGLDEIKVFLKDDRTCAFIALRGYRLGRPRSKGRRCRADIAAWHWHSSQRTWSCHSHWQRSSRISLRSIGQDDFQIFPKSCLLPREKKSPRPMRPNLDRSTKPSKVGTTRLTMENMPSPVTRP